MKKGRSQRSSRKMKPVFLVFCEGGTEETYINFLRLEYRLLIKIIPRITGLSISPSIIKRYIKAEQIDSNDKIISFLMYDLDTESIVKKLADCRDSINIASNPSVELWFLLHIREQIASISTGECIEKLRKATEEWVYYKKGTLSDHQKKILWDNRLIASDRANRLPDDFNPSSKIYLLIDEMEKTKKISYER